SGTSSPEARIGSTRRPSSVPASIALRNISPVETCGIPYASERRVACVPFPDPWGPSTRRFTTCPQRQQGAGWHPPRRPPLRAASAEEPLVVAHHHLRLHLAHGVERHADGDQHGRAAEGPGIRLGEPAVPDEQARRDRNGGE